MVAERMAVRPAKALTPQPPAAVSAVALSAADAARPLAARRKDASSLDDDEIVGAMRAHDFKIKAAAVALGVSRSWLNMRLETCQGVRKAKDLGREEILNAARSSNGDLSAMAERLQVSEHGLKLRMRALEIGDR
jgi:transcriptional regulator of acetoin/glycerol metabolism